MITQNKLNFLNSLLDQELQQLTQSCDLRDIPNNKISSLESHLQRNNDNQLGSQQSIIERAFPTLGVKDTDEDFTPFKQTQRKSTRIRATSSKHKKLSIEQKKSLKKVSQEQINAKALILEKQKNSELQQEVKQLSKKFKKAQASITQLKQQLLENEKFKENFLKSESIRQQQKELIQFLKKEIDQLKRK
ncbi:unnamed protein product (macronuclear) [Paramecium tetraurelia]|uniref:Uncharacterized protein n=1 Tax=Paramecium tetraurelia TaxID=5888 RepID=A0BPM2_PARTE|nr:uncharacterized protein GSPATT00005238001 [Paramecium tetraurelia]CAK60489.1 unnamed protein product [Paramecium tetraurelia]|eukprot:XP_001427887.1 hypothetical protein (macronuclear) [Paramecium tetraurelia strain d4-2]